MTLLEVTYLDVLHEICLQRGLAVLLTADYAPSRFAEPSRTVLRDLDVVRPETTAVMGGMPDASRRQRIRAGELIVRAPLESVDGDLQAAAELLVQVLTRASAKAA